MKVLINAYTLQAGHKGAGGAGKYLHTLIDGLSRQATVRVLCSLENKSLFDALSGVQVVPLPDNDARLVEVHCSFADVYYCPLNGFSPHLLMSRVPVVSFLHDLQHMHYPFFFKDGNYAARLKDYGLAVARSDCMLANSQFERENLLRFYNKKAVHVVHHAPFLAERYVGRSESDKGASVSGGIPYLLYPAVPWIHKNHYRLVEAFLFLKKHLGYNRPLKLVLAGAEQHDMATEPLHKHLVHNNDLKDSVEFLGFISDDELASLYKGALAIVFPSLYEGFGIPLADAMLFGVPVLTTRLSAIPEVCGEAAAYFSDPFDSGAMARDMLNFLQNERQREKLRRLGKARVATFSTERMVSETLNCFQDAIELAGDSGTTDSRLGSDCILQNHLLKWDSSADLWAKEPLTVIVLRGETSCFDEEPRPRRERKQKSAARPTGAPFAFAPESADGVRRIFVEDRSAVSEQSMSSRADSKERHTGDRVVYCDFENRLDVITSLHFLFSNLLHTEYFMIVKADDLPAISLRELRNVIALLDFSRELSSLEIDPSLKRAPWKASVDAFDTKEWSQVRRIKAYEEIKTNPLDRFLNVIIRTSSMSDIDCIGTLAFVKNFVTNWRGMRVPAHEDDGRNR